MRYKIYSKDGSTVRCETEKLEYNGQFMGDSSITASVKSNVHIAFEVGDYITYRGNNFTLGNIPKEKKTGHKNANGEVFQYDSMKFESYITELANADFNDFVGDSQTDISFTAQPNFSFVAATIDDLLQRIQVNMNRYYTGTKQWTIKADSTYTTPDDYTNMLITVSNISCWDALAYVNSKYGVNFIVRGRTVTVGTAGSVKDITFKVGRYKGLYDMTRNSQTDQQIVTRLKSYGNTTNINPRYYSLVGATVTAKLTTFDYIASSYSLFFLFDLNHTTELNDTVKFNISGSSVSYELQGTWGIYKDYTFGNRGLAESFAAYKVDTTSAIYKDVKAKVLSVGYANTSVTFVSGVRKDNISDLSHLSFDANSKLPNNMNIANLMLPSFPTGTLADWVEANKSKYTWLQDYINAGYTFSTEKYYPYINSKNVTDLGVRPHTEYFTSEDDTHKDIYPSLQYFSDDRNQVVGATASDGSAISDSGVFADGASVDPFYIIINDLGFEFDDVAVNGTSPKIHFNSGYCGGRDFTVSSWTKDGTTWKLKCARIKDDSIGKYFPYVDAPIKKGDKFVITDIYMPDTYIEQASVTLLKWSLKWLAKNDYSVFSYQLTPDINFIKRHDDAVTDKSATFHYTIMEGDVLLIEDTDMGVTGSITIDNIKITEGDGLLPKYEITLRDTKTVGTVQKIQQQIDAIVSGGVSGGYNSTQVGEIAYSALKDKFLSKVSADTAKGLITFLQGLLIGDGKYSIDKDGNAKLLSLLINSLYGIDKNGNATLNSVLMGSFEHLAQGLGLYKNSAGHWCIECDDAYFRMKAVFEQLEIRKMYSSAGNINISPSGSKITRVEWLDASGNITTVAADTVAYKCYFLADDGTTATTNSWQAKDYALCKTFNIKEGVYTNVSNQYYWRKVTDAGSGYITLGNLTGQFDEGSTIPQAGDSVVMRGSDTDGRKSYIEILSNDENAPAILMFADCMGFASKGQNTAIISPEKVQFATKVFKLIDYDNVATPVVIYKGVYDASKVYYYNNSVTYNGSLWVLDGVAVGASAAAGTEPKDGSTVWTKQVSKGSNGTSGVTYWSSPSVLMIDATKNGSSTNVKEPFSKEVDFYAKIGDTFLTAGAAAISGSVYEDSDMTAITSTVGKVTFGDDGSIIDGIITVTVPFTDASGNSYTHDFPIEVKAVVSGKGIKSVTVMYLATTVSSVSDYEAFKEATGWTTTEQSVSITAPYLWTYQITFYSDNTQVATVPHIIGTYGKNGNAGKNGYSLYLSPSEIVVDSDDSGIVTDFTNAFTNVYFTIGDSYTVASEIVASSITCVHCTASANGGRLSITAIPTDDTTDMSYGSGYITFQAKLVVGDTTYVGIGKVYFSVNIYTVTSKIIKTNSSITTEVDSVKTRVDDIQTLTQNTSAALNILDGKINSKVSQSDFDSEKTSVDNKFTEVLQTAESYSIKVGEIQSGRRNMLVGTAFRRKDEFLYNNEAAFPTYVAASCSIQKNTGYKGTNAIYINRTDTVQRFIGLRWENITIITGATYMFSVLVKSPDITTFTQGASIELRVNPSGANKSFSTSFVPSKSGVWQQITWSFTVPATVLNETTSKNEVPTSVTVMMYIVAAGKLYLCRPMMEQSDTFTGWSLSEKDFDYVGGNILPNSRLLTDLTGNNLAPNIQWSPTKVDNGYGDCTTLYQSFNSSTSYTKDTLKWLNSLTLKQNTDYIFSMWVKGSGYVHMFLYCDTDTSNNPCAFVENSDGVTSSGADGWNYIKLTSDWRRIWVHFRTNTTFDVTKKITLTAIRQWYDSTSSLELFNHSSLSITVASPKLEPGVTVTNYSESGDDMVSKKALLATGIDVTAGMIKGTSDNFIIQNNSGTTTFSVDENGNIVGAGNASFKGAVYAKDGTFSGTVYATGGDIGGLKISETIPSIDLTKQGYQNYLSPLSMTFFSVETVNQVYSIVSVPSYQISNYTSTDPGMGMIHVQMTGYDKSLPAYTAKFGSTNSGDAKDGIGFSTNGGILAQWAKTLGGVPFLNILCHGTITGGTSPSVSGTFFVSSGSFSISRSGTGRYVVTHPSLYGYFHKVIVMGRGTDLMKGTVVSESSTGFTVDASDDSTTNDGDLSFIIIGYML